MDSPPGADLLLGIAFVEVVYFYSKNTTWGLKLVLVLSRCEQVFYFFRLGKF